MLESSLHHGEMSVPVRPFSAIVRSVAGYGVATALMLVSPLLVFAPASLFHCAMRNGRFAAWTAAVVGVALAGLYFAQVANASTGAQVKLVYASFTGIALSIALPSMIAVPLVEHRRRFGVVLTYVLFFSAAGLVLTELIMRAASFSPYLAQVAEASALANRMADANRAVMPRQAVWILTHSPQVLPAMILFDIALVFVLSLMMFGRLSVWHAFAKTRVADPDSRRPYLFRDLQLPEWLLFLFVIGGLTPVLSGVPQKIAANVLITMICLYTLQGVSIVRSVLVRANAGFLGGTLGFVVLIMLCLTTRGFGFAVLVGLGLFDPFIDFRKLNRKDDSHESHTD